MSKSLLFRIFGLGKVPKKLLPDIEHEGIVLIDEGIGGSVTFRNYRAQWKRFKWKRSWFCGSLVVTEKRFWGFAFSKPIMSVPLDDELIKELHCDIEGETTFCARFDVSRFQEGCSGTIECRFTTLKAGLFMEHIKQWVT